MIIKAGSNWLTVATIVVSFLSYSVPVYAQQDSTKSTIESRANRKIFYGQASFYANKFHGRRTANGEIFSQDKLTAACNLLPLGTWIKVTNLKNDKFLIVRTNDRLNPKTRRLLDLTKSAAKELGYVTRGLTRIKMEVLDQKKYKLVAK